MRYALLLILLEALLSQNLYAQWIRPADAPDSKPIWGIKDGISVGLWPTPGPRGLIRIYTPYLRQQPGYIEQYIAVEPIVAGRRDLSEMQTSQSDKKQGKMMWAIDAIDQPHGKTPAAGIVTRDGANDSFSFFIDVERFDNGAHPIIKLTLHDDRPHEIELQTLAAADSAPMESCVLSATMGNMSRLRHLHLQNRTITANDVFQNQQRGYWDFYPWHDFKDLHMENGEAIFTATGEVDGDTSKPAPAAWRYQGVAARQYWRTKLCPGLLGRVNGRSTFWGTHADIPGGAAFENFELFSPFSSGQTFCFGLEADSPQDSPAK